MSRSAPSTPSRHPHLAYMQHRGVSPVTASSTPSPPSSPAARTHARTATRRRPIRSTSDSQSHTLRTIPAPLSTSFAGTFDYPQIHRDLLFHLHLLKFMTTEYIPLLTFAWGAGEVTEQEFEGEQGRFENRRVVLTMVIRGENELLKERFVLSSFS
ncbi:hypothetical protein B9Z19DRAFT_1066045 [Tuber borchii]|uniref:Uncharacterized protein n=1 Tax=Tuber borchii TaxID=42251 RepID=A0A2T6ZNV0_TUBBO|nr:hypothetical protein B9Z19DRAFT_1066045 [Tuber borchii]